MMSGAWQGFVRVTRKYPIVRGMMSYALTWPCCSLAQEYIEFGVPLSDANWPRAARFSLFGAFFVSPVIYTWMKYTQPLFPGLSMVTCLKRSLFEQVTYGPFALSYFLFGMSLLKLNGINKSVEEVKEKFWPAYKVGFGYWMTAQTINYGLVPPKNRVVFLSAASFIWTVYMAHIMSERHKEDKTKERKEKLML
ncbi:hypothetical protein O0L34_g1450 [Tuta absoluta]|nr:hypothetical protein O0L34_g1450 [Tuta absoluta]